MMLEVVFILLIMRILVFLGKKKTEFIGNLKVAKNFSVPYEQAYEQFEDEFHKVNILREDYENL